MPKTVTDFDIQALIDNELDWEDEKRVRDYLRSHDWAKKRYEELRAQKETLQRWWMNTKEH